MPVGSCGSPVRCLICLLGPDNGLCCCTVLLWPLLWGWELLNRESPLGHLATSFLLPSTEGDLAQDKEWAHEHYETTSLEGKAPLLALNHLPAWLFLP